MDKVKKRLKHVKELAEKNASTAAGMMLIGMTINEFTCENDALITDFKNGVKDVQSGLDNSNQTSIDDGRL